MKMRILALATAAALGLGGIAGCSTTTSTASGGSPMAKRESIDASVDAALTKLYQQVPGSRELVAKSRGTLVFPSVLSAGFVVGGSYGEGALRRGSRTVAYYSTAAGSIGLLAGAESKSVILLFMTQDVLDMFAARKGWTVGAAASVTLVTVGANAQIDSKTAQQSIIGFVLTNGGLMANVSLEGTKFTRLEI